MSLLSVRGLTTAFQTARGEITAIEDVSFDLNEGEILGIVGESGSGKSVTALTIMGLLPRPPARIAAGSVWFDGRELTGLSESAMQRLSRLCHRIVWLNPHKGDRTTFTPDTLGMMVAEPYVDELLSGHDLASLSEFARILVTLR